MKRRLWLDEREWLEAPLLAHGISIHYVESMRRYWEETQRKICWLCRKPTPSRGARFCESCVEGPLRCAAKQRGMSVTSLMMMLREMSDDHYVPRLFPEENRSCKHEEVVRNIMPLDEVFTRLLMERLGKQ